MYRTYRIFQRKLFSIIKTDTLVIDKNNTILGLLNGFTNFCSRFK